MQGTIGSVGEIETDLEIQDRIAVNALVIDDDVIMRLGLRTILEASDQVAVVGEAESRRDALAQVRRLSPDVVLLDTRTPENEILTELCALAQRAPVLVLAYDQSPAAVEQALRAGATGYLVHGQYSPDELVSAVVATADGEPRLSPAAIRVLIDRLRVAHRSHDPARAQRLSRREMEIVEHLVRGCTNAEIARSLGISEKTVKNHVNHVYSKLRTRNRAETVALWLGQDAPSAAAQ